MKILETHVLNKRLNDPGLSWNAMLKRLISLILISFDLLKKGIEQERLKEIKNEVNNSNTITFFELISKKYLHDLQDSDSVKMPTKWKELNRLCN